MTESGRVMDILERHPVDLLEFGDSFHEQDIDHLGRHMHIYFNLLWRFQIKPRVYIIDPLLSHEKYRFVENYVDPL
jgi:hypothetical protein